MGKANAKKVPNYLIQKYTGAIVLKWIEVFPIPILK